MSKDHGSDEFDYKNSLVYMNSTAALMETLFRNMKNEDFVYPSKKQVGADDGAIIRSEELMRRQKAAATESLPFVIRDPYLESMLAKMSDEDFTYETKKPVDPNYGRVVRALELMELAGPSTEPVIKVEEKKKEPSVQKENIVAPAEQYSTQPHTRYSNSHSGESDRATPENGQKRFGGTYKKQNNKNRVKYDIPTWKNDRRSVGNDNGYQARRQSNDNYRPANNNGHHMSNNNGGHFYENRTFSPQNGMFNNGFRGSNSAPRHNKSNGYGHGSSRGRGNQYGGHHGNNGQQRTGDSSALYWNNNNQAVNSAQELWGQPANDNQMLWK